MLKKMTPKQLKKMLKGGEGEVAETAAPEGDMEGARRRRRSRRASRKSRRGLFY